MRDLGGGDSPAAAWPGLNAAGEDSRTAVARPSSVGRITVGDMLPVVVAGAAVLLVLMSFGVVWAMRFPAIGTVNDTWFGADVQRHVAWVIERYDRARWHLHPLSYVAFKAWGFLLYGLGRVPSSHALPVLALPALLPVAFGVAVAARVLRPDGAAAGYAQAIAALLLIGPLLVFGGIPESHAPGGTALLLLASLTIPLLVQPGGLCSRRRLFAVLVLAAVATGFTLSNALPAAMLLLPVQRARRILVWSAVGAAVAGAVVLVAHGIVRPIGFVADVRAAVEYELNWLASPDAVQLWWSFRNLVIYQFGVPSTELVTWTNPFNGWLVTSVATARATPLQVLGLLLWTIGVLRWAALGRPAAPGRRILPLFLAIIASLVAFHTVYATAEAYIFATHVWPFVVVPGVLAWTDARRVGDRPTLACLGAAAALSLVQLGIGLFILWTLQGTVGAAGLG